MGASATPARVMKGIRGPGQMGNLSRRPNPAWRSSPSTPRQNLLMVRGSVPGPRGGVVEVRGRWLTPHSKRRLGGCHREASVGLDDTRLLCRFPRAARAPERARRAGRPPRRAAPPPRPAAMVSGGSGQAMAPKGHRASPRRLQPFADLDRGRHVFLQAPSPVPTPSRSTARSSARHCAARSRCTPRAGRWRWSMPTPSPRPRPARRWICSMIGVNPAPPWSPLAAPEESDAALSFRNLARVAVLVHEDVGVADLVGCCLTGALAGRARGAHGSRRRRSRSCHGHREDAPSRRPESPRDAPEAPEAGEE